MPDEAKPVTCPKCAKESYSAIIHLPTGQLSCTRCHADLPMTLLPDPRRPAREDLPSASELAAQVRSGRLRKLLLAFDGQDVIKGSALSDLWWGEDYIDKYDNHNTDQNVERQVRRYNETLRELGAGFIFRYSRGTSALIRVALEY